MEREQITEAAASVPDIVFATLFGSRADDRARSDSDWDVGVYLDTALDARERSRIRLRLVAALEPAIRIDVVILNEAPALLARRALDGERLFIRDRRAFVRFVVRTLAAAGDEAYWRDLHARERARRLAGGLVDREVFDRRLAKLEELLRDLRSLAATDREAFLADRGLEAQAERWLQLAAECALDLAHHLIADRGWKTPATYREAFEVLRAEGVLDVGLAEQMQDWAGLRNVLTHLYLEVDHERLYEILRGELGQLERYAAALSQELVR